MGMLSDKKMFFKELYGAIEKSCSSEQLRNFANLDTDEARFQFVQQLAGIEGITVLQRGELAATKSSTGALDYKKQGNARFQAGYWPAALDCYNKSLMLMPAENVEDMSIVLANRSAALYHMELYDLAIGDIDLAIPDYPQKMLHKLTERKARCFLAKEDFPQALELFKQTIKALDHCELALDRRNKMERDAQIMVKMLPKQIENAMKMEKMQKTVAKPKASSTKKNELNKSVAFNYTANEGRFAVAKSDIKIGEKILVEEPHVVMLLEKYAKTNCQHCFKRTIAPLACPTCTDVIFCSKSCREVAVGGYHKYECGVLPTLWNSGSSINCHMALRMLSQKGVSYFVQLKEQLEAGIEFDSTTKLPTSDYRKVYNLVRHEGTRGTQSFLHYSAMSYFLAHCLRIGGFFEETANASDFTFIGSLLLRNLQFLQFNTHEVYELHEDKKTSKTIFIGGGLYPTLALFNHSCDPGIVRYYKGTSVHVHAIGNIKGGSVIAENYGPLYSQNSIEERKSTLKEQYWFDCNCRACEDDWPLYDEMNTKEIRFKCDGEVPCDNVLTIPIDCDAFMIKCKDCDKFTNILKGLKAMQDTDILGKTAKRLIDEGNYAKAIHKYIEMINIMDAVLAPPFRDYCNCQQSIKDCLLQYGNKWISTA